MKYQITLFCMLFSLFLTAAPARNLPAITIHMDSENTQPQVAQTGKMVSVDAPSHRNDSNTPRGSAAGRLAINGKEFIWTPSQIKGKITGGADLISAVLSGDETVLLLAERIGGTDMPNSTRLILLNLRNKKIIRHVLLEKSRISELHFIPGSNTVLAVRNAQLEFGHKNSLVKIDLRRGRVTAQSHPAQEKITSVCTDGSKAWYTVKNDQQVYEIDLDDFKAAPVTIRTTAENPRAALSPDGKTLLLFGQKQFELFRVGNDDTKPALFQTSAIDPGFAPAEALFLDDKGELILLLEPEKQAVLFRNGTPHVFPEKYGNAATFFKSENLLLLGLLKHNSIAKVRLPDTAFEGKPVVPGKLKPLSRNGTWKILGLSGNSPQAILIDTRGNVMRLEITKRRWKKQMILTVDKTGFR